MEINAHEFYKIANTQGQRRLGRETFEEFEKRVMELYKVRENKPPPWRVTNAAVGEKR